MGTDVFKFFRNFVVIRENSGELNHTLIYVIPKIKQPKQISNLGQYLCVMCL